MEEPDEYRARHADFVSHNNGTTPEEILLLGLPVHSSLLLLAGLALWRGATFTSLPGRALEATVLCLPPLLSLTVLSSAPWLLSLPLAAVGAAALLLATRTKAPPPHDLPNTVASGRLPYITNYRASMLLITTICILAVDFPVFPRRLAKTETFGHGLMDLGVGSFVFGAGLVSPEARGAPQEFGRSALGALPLLMLGGLRLLALQATGYHHVVTEYGQHWNFFFTLAAVRLLAGCLARLLQGPGRRAWLLAVGAAVAHELVLAEGAQDWVLGPAGRQGWLEANREGLVSCPGYLALYVAGVAWGRDLLARTDLLATAGLLAGWAALMWGNLLYTSTIFPPPSRRLANYNFFTWTLAYNLTLLAGFALLDLLVVTVAELQDPRRGPPPASRPGKAKKSHSLRQSLLRKAPTTATHPPPPGLYRSPGLYQAIAHNGLAFFLAANLATGAVNLALPTISTEAGPALAILATYLALLSAGALLAWRAGLTIKFW
jgi:hypothetical protein